MEDSAAVHALNELFKLTQKDQKSVMTDQIIDYSSLALYIGLSVFFVWTSYKTL